MRGALLLSLVAVVGILGAVSGYADQCCATEKAAVAKADAAAGQCCAAEKAAVAKASPGTVGSVAPPFTLQDQNGTPVSLADYKGKVVVLAWWNEGCPFIVRHAKAGTLNRIADTYRQRDVVVLAINSTKNTTNDSNKKAAEQYGVNFPILNDASGAVGKAYAAKTTPHMYVIDRSGNLAYAGAIDDDASGRKSDPTSYVTLAIEDILAGRQVATAESKPYGCSVHYAK